MDINNNETKTFLPNKNNAGRKAIYLDYIEAVEKFYKPAMEIIEESLKATRDKLTLSEVIINPIDFVESRIKDFDKLWEKYIKNFGKEPENLDEIISKIYDIGGMRVICTYRDDIYIVKRLIGMLKNVEVLNEDRDKSRDYVANPKESGYASLHLRVRVFINGRPVIIEIQIRTMLMHIWSKIEHNLRYKNANASPILDKIFTLLSKIFSKLDSMLMAVRDGGNDMTEDEFKNLIDAIVVFKKEK